MSIIKRNVAGVLAKLFFFNDTATTEIYTLSLHDALPISAGAAAPPGGPAGRARGAPPHRSAPSPAHRRHAGCRTSRSEEHTSELQSQSNLVCRLLLEKKKDTHRTIAATRGTIAEVVTTQG